MADSLSHKLHADSLWVSIQAVALPLAAAIITVGVLSARAPDVFVPQFWAEDSFFWRDAYLDGPPALFRPYAGYFVTAPRLIAALSTLWHPIWAPTVFVMITISVTAWCAFTAASSRVPRWLGFTLGVTLLLAPQETGDIFGYAVNLQWVAAPVLAVIAATAPPDSRCSRANQAFFASIAAFTGPFAVFLAPLFIVRMVRYRDLASTTALLGGVAQFAVMFLTAKSFPSDGESDWLHLMAAFAQQLAPGPIAALAATLLVCLSVMIPHGRRLRLGLLFLGACVCLGTLLRFEQQPLAFDTPGQAGRYIFIQHAVLIWCAASLAFTHNRARWVAGAASVVLLLSFPLALYQRAAPPNKQWKNYAPEIGARPVEIPTLPDWTLDLP
jgi:hypothetical protein